MQSTCKHPSPRKGCRKCQTGEVDIDLTAPPPPGPENDPAFGPA